MIAKVSQAVIMAAGTSTRTYPLTVDRPKPLLPVVNKPILQHLLAQLQGLVEEVILIVGFEQAQIRAAFGERFYGMRLIYVEQTNPMGTGDALRQALPFIHGRFFLLYGDDLIHRSDLERLAQYPYAVLCTSVPDPRPYNVLVLTPDDYILRIIEKPDMQTIQRIASTAATATTAAAATTAATAAAAAAGALSSFAPYVLESEVAEAVDAIELSPRGEYELVDIAENLPGGHHLKAVRMQAYWLPVGYPWKLLEANRFLLNRDPPPLSVLDIGPHVTIEAPVLIGPGTVVEAGCTLGAGTTLGRNCHIAAGSRLINCLIMDNVQVGEACHLEDSIVMDDVVIEREVVTLTQASDSSTIRSQVKGELLDTGRRSLGVVLAHDVHVGPRCQFHPGIKVWPGQYIPMDCDVKVDIEKEVSCGPSNVA
jgi:bifunctional UDP-N-acetylglucosamine pyrophosphorylase/glucosamine-1-phosphate N-acetyltransferase